MKEVHLKVIEGYVLATFKKVLREKDKVATQKTIRSLRMVTQQTGTRTTLDLYAFKSLFFIQAGRNKDRTPPPISPIEAWIKARKIQFKDKKGKDLSTKSMAFLISRSIGKKGISPTDVVGQAEKYLKPFLSVFLRQQIALDFKSFIQKNK